MSVLRHNMEMINNSLQCINRTFEKNKKFKFEKYYYISFFKKEDNFLNNYEIVTTMHPFVWLKQRREEGDDVYIISYQGISEQDYSMFEAVKL